MTLANPYQPPHAVPKPQESSRTVAYWAAVLPQLWVAATVANSLVALYVNHYLRPTYLPVVVQVGPSLACDLMLVTWIAALALRTGSRPLAAASLIAALSFATTLVPYLQGNRYPQFPEMIQPLAFLVMAPAFLRMQHPVRSGPPLRMVALALFLFAKPAVGSFGHRWAVSLLLHFDALRGMSHARENALIAVVSSSMSLAVLVGIECCFYGRAFRELRYIPFRNRPDGV